MWVNRILVGCVTAVIVIAAVDAIRSSDDGTVEPPTTAATAQGATIHRCAQRDLAVTIALRRAPDWQVGKQAGDYEVQAPRHQRVATIVARNVGTRRCLFVLASSHLTITDRTGKVVAKWNGGTWFERWYAPGSERLMSVPDTYRCDRPGPYLATARVGLHRARLGGLSGSEITC